MSNLYLPGYAFIISLILNVIFFSKKRLKSKETKAFKFMLVSSLIDSFLLLIVLILGVIGKYAILLIDILNKIDFIMYLVWIVGFFVYNLQLLSLQDKHYELIKKISIVLGIILGVLIIISPINSVNNNGVMYVDGLSSNILYLAIILYFIFIISMLIVNIKNLFNKKYVPMVVLVLIISLGLFLRSYDPTLLITSSILALTNLIMYFTILNPDINLLEEISRNRELIERNNEDKSNLMFKISYDLKSPIRKLISLSDNLLIKNNEEDIKVYLRKINNDLRHILFSLNYEFSTKINYNKLKIVDNSYNIKLVFNEIITLIKHNNKKLLFNYNIKDCPNYLYGDSLKLKQLILSVINNSIKNNNESLIALNLNTIIKYDICRLVFTIDVSDYEMVLKDINDIMYGNRVNLSYEKDLFNMDLISVKNLIEILGGTLFINSDNGKTTFKIIIDQRIKKDENDLLVDKINETLKLINNKKKVLVVNDNYEEAKIISNYLRSKNYLVVTCLTYLDFENKVNEYKYDLILLDDEFDNKTANELCDKINKGKIIAMLSKDKGLIRKHYINDKRYKDVLCKDNLISELKRIID